MASRFRFHFMTGLGLAAFLATICWYGLGLQTGFWPILCAWLAGINVATFLYFGFDKYRATRGGGRVPELALHAMAAVGGSPAAWLAMQTFRHKTVKGSFRIVFFGVVLLQVVLLLWAAKTALRG